MNTKNQQQIKDPNSNQFDWNVYNQLINSAREFFEASIRCSLIESIKLNKMPLMAPDFTNRALACELYLKATLYLD